MFLKSIIFKLLSLKSWSRFVRLKLFQFAVCLHFHSTNKTDFENFLFTIQSWCMLCRDQGKYLGKMAWKIIVRSLLLLRLLLALKNALANFASKFLVMVIGSWGVLDALGPLLGGCMWECGILLPVCLLRSCLCALGWTGSSSGQLQKKRVLQAPACVPGRAAVSVL